MLNCTVSDPTQLGVPEGASGAVLGALEGYYVFMCFAPSFLRSARARHAHHGIKTRPVVCDVSCRGESGDIWADMAGYDRISGMPADTV